MRRLKKPFLAECARQGLAVLLTGCFVSQATVQAAGSPAVQLPTGGAYAAGTGSIKSSGNAVTINQSSLRGIIDWSTFSIGQGGTVTFKNGNGATLNRVNGGQMSSLLGSLIASGTVYVINPQGVLVGPSGRVQIGGDFVASTLHLSGDNFMQGGAQTFTGSNNTVVINLGKISSTGGNVYLLGQNVTNNGAISAPNGSVGLGAGSQILLSNGDQHVFVQAAGGDVTNSGSIQAAQAELRTKGGNIYALAGNNKAVIAATGTSTKDGKVWLVADGGSTHVSGTITAKNANGNGGSIETSGEHLDLGKATVKTGQGGDWLLDPVDLTIDSTAATTIQNSLGSSNVTVSTSATSSNGPGTVSQGGSGDINLSSPITWSSNNSFNVSAYRNVNVNANVSNTGAGNLTLRADNTANGTGAVNFSNGAMLNWSGSTGAISLFYDPLAGLGSKYANPITYTSSVQTNTSWVMPSDRSITTQFTPYMLVNNPTDLESVTATGIYAVGANIDLSSIPNFTPIASFNSGSIFDGQGKTISNLHINTTNSVGGLFVTINGNVRNLNLTNESITAQNGGESGGLAGYITPGAVISSVQTSGTISGASENGGLVGFNEGGTILNSGSTANVTGSVAGGLVGYNEGPITASFAGGTVSATSQGGGLVGENGAPMVLGGWSAVITDSYATGAVSSSAGDAGGLVGYNSPGGIMMPPFNSAPGTIINSFSTGQVSGAATKGGLVGYQAGSVVNSYWDATSSGINAAVGSGTSTGITSQTTAQLQNGTLPTGFTSSRWTLSAGAYPRLVWQIPPTVAVSGEVFNGTTPLAGITVEGLASGMVIGTGTTDSQGNYSFTAPSSTTGILAILLGATSGNTFSDGKGVGDFTGMDIYANQIRLMNTTNRTYSGLMTVLATAMGGNTTGMLFSLNAGSLLVNPGATLQTATTGDFTLDGVVSGPGDMTFASTGNLTLASNAHINTSGTLTLSDGGSFTDNGATINFIDSGKWLLYSQDPANDTLGGFASPSFWQYNAAYGTTPQGTGNGILYALAPTVTVGYNGTIEKTYDATNTASLNQNNLSFTGLVAGDTAVASGTASGSYADANAGTNKAVTLSEPSLTITHNNAPVYGYNETAASNLTGTIDPATLTLLVTGPSKVYDGTTSANGWTQNGGLSGIQGSDSVTYNREDSVATFSSKNASNSDAFTVTGVTLEGAAAANYVLGPVTGVGTITKATLTASLTVIDKYYDGTTFAIGGLGDLVGIKGRDVVSTDNIGTMSFSDKNVGTAKTVTDSGATLMGADAGNYTLSVGSTTANIMPAFLTATVSATNKVYDGTTSDNASLTLSGVFGDDQVSASATSYAFNNKNAGTNKSVYASGVTLSGTDAANYEVEGANHGTANITPKPVTGIVWANSKTYDGTTADTGSLHLSGLVGEDNVTGTATYSFADKNAGTSKLVTGSNGSLSGSDAGNYTLASISPDHANINPAPLMATVNATDKVYDGTTTDLGSLTLTGVLSNDQVSASAGYTFINKNAGQNKAVIATNLSLSGTDAGNYEVETVLTGIANITPKPISGIVLASSKTYDGTTADNGSLSLPGVVEGDNVTGTAAYNFANKNAGTSKLVTASNASLTGDDAANYTLTSVASDHANIAPAALLVTVHGTNKIYDGTTTDTGYLTVSGVVEDDQVSASAGYSFADKNAGQGKRVTATNLSLSGADAANYEVENVTNGAAAILQKPISGIVLADSKTYDGTTADTGSLNLTGLVEGDHVTGGATYTFADKNAGTAKLVTGSDAILSGTDAGNYTIASVAPDHANITPAALLATVNATGKVYDGTRTDTGSISLSGVVSGDQVMATSTYAFNNKNAGQNKPVTVSDLALNGTDAANYEIESVTNGTANITPKPINTIVLADNKTYDGTTADTGSLRLTGIVGEDQVSGTATYNFADKNAGTSKLVTGSNAVLTGNDAGNYTVATIASDHANITPAALLASVNATDKVYDGTTTASGSLSLSGVVSGDQVTSSASYAFNNKNAGQNKPVMASNVALNGADAANYEVESVTNGTASVTPATLTATYSADSKTYDATAAATGTMGALTGVVSGDQVSLTGAAQYAFNNKNAGQSKPVSANGVSLTGSDAGNYTLTLLQTGHSNIDPATLYYVSNTATKSFGADTPALSGSVTGFKGSDSLASTSTGTAVFMTPATAASTIGTYAVNGSGLSLTTGNYTLAQALTNSTALAVTPISISIGNVSRVSGTPNPAFTINYSGPQSQYLQSLLSGLQLVTDAPASDAPGAYHITAIVPQALMDDITVQTGTLTITAGPMQNATQKPAALQTVPVVTPAPVPATTTSNTLPSNATNQFQVSVVPVQAVNTPVQTSAPSLTQPNLNGDALSHASFDDPNSDNSGTGAGSGTDAKTYSTGAH